MKIQLAHKFEDIISVENLVGAWGEFVRGKRNKKDVQEFALHLMDNIIALHNDLVNHIYKHGQYQVFNIHDPKPRIIHKATVRDRLLHHVIHRLLYPFFDTTFISNSFSCRLNRGTHKALNRFYSIGRQVSANNTKPCWVLKGDIKKFFANINHCILIDILRASIPDCRVIWLLHQVIASFHSTEQAIGLPLGNLTSQLFANIYLNQFDQFVKHKLKLKHYIRYADDFVVFSASRTKLEMLIAPMQSFLSNHLRLTLHPQKIFIKTLFSGVDFLGWVNFPSHRVLRTATKKRMLNNITIKPVLPVLNSYLGLLRHGNTQKLQRKLLKRFVTEQSFYDRMAGEYFNSF